MSAQAKKQYRIGCLLLLWLGASPFLCAEERAYLCELGIQGGIGYYVGDATGHIFNHVQPSYGAQFRYKFNSRWALQVKGQADHITYPLQGEDGLLNGQMGKNQLVNLDVVGEFNFFRFGQKQYDSRVKPITPYIFVGVGVSLYNRFNAVTGYIPFGFGLKWKISQHIGLNVAWQHQLYFTDNLENTDYYNDPHQLNGHNFLNNDLTSSLVVGIVVEFAKQKAVCRSCGD